MIWTFICCFPLTKTLNDLDFCLLFLTLRDMSIYDALNIAPNFMHPDTSMASRCLRPSVQTPRRLWLYGEFDQRIAFPFWNNSFAHSWQISKVNCPKSSRGPKKKRLISLVCIVCILVWHGDALKSVCCRPSKRLCFQWRSCWIYWAYTDENASTTAKRCEAQNGHPSWKTFWVDGQVASQQAATHVIWSHLGVSFFENFMFSFRFLWRFQGLWWEQHQGYCNLCPQYPTWSLWSTMLLTLWRIPELPSQSSTGPLCGRKCVGMGFWHHLLFASNVSMLAVPGEFSFVEFSDGCLR